MKELKSVPLTQRKSHFRNLAALAGKDGAIRPEERSVLAFVAAKWGLSDRDIEDTNTNPNAITLSLPEGREERFQELYDLCEMMLIDGVVKKDEKSLCQAMAEKLGFPGTAVDSVLQAIVAGNRRGDDESQIHVALRKTLGC